MTDGYCISGCGSEITASGVESVIYRFAGGADGKNPWAPLVAVGARYTERPPPAAATKNGNVVKIAASGEETVIHRFAGQPSDGGVPLAGLADVGGRLYGTTRSGGANNMGTVFSIRL